MPNHPLVSIVTPSLNMGEYLPGTIQSVLGQDYQNLQYIVMDGGSKDGTRETLHSFRESLEYESRQDAGAADALRRGFERCDGEILAYLNADDEYLPGAVSAAVRAFEDHPEVEVVYGDGLWMDRDGAAIGRYPTREFDAGDLGRECFICQPAVFFRRSAYESVGGIDASLEYTYDYDLWLRLAKKPSFLHVNRLLAKSRMYPENKSLGSRRRVFRETIDTVIANTGQAGFGHVYAYACHLLDGRDQFFEPLRPSMFKFGLAMVLGLAFNGPLCGRFWLDSARSIGKLRGIADELPIFRSARAGVRTL